MRVGVLASGSGTILESILAEGIDVAVVVVDRPCRAAQVARGAGVAVTTVERKFGPGYDRAAHSRLVLGALDDHGVELVTMAGFGTILDEVVPDAYEGRILNTHPSLLPAFPGWHAVEDALAAGVVVTGCTVHLVVPEVDAGPILAQEEVPVLPGDDVARLHERIKAVERRLYPQVIRDRAA